MSKTIATLVPDIYALLEKGQPKIDAQKLGEMITGRLSLGTGGPALRMSNIGEKCLRKLWYREHSPELAAPILGPTKLKFLIGDIHEEVILSLAEQAGHQVEARQEEVEFEGVKGHVDAIIDGVVFDVKSANSRGMDKFKSHRLEQDDPFGYLDQIGIYAEALKEDPRVRDKDRVAFGASDKELGHLVLDVYPVRPKPWKDIIRRIKDVLGKGEPPGRYYSDEPDGASGNRSLCLQCRYCDYKEECYKDSNNGTGLRKYIYSNGPKFLTKIMREPNVPKEY